LRVGRILERKRSELDEVFISVGPDVCVGQVRDGSGLADIGRWRDVLEAGLLLLTASAEVDRAGTDGSEDWGVSVIVPCDRAGRSRGTTGAGNGFGNVDGCRSQSGGKERCSSKRTHSGQKQKFTEVESWVKKL